MIEMRDLIYLFKRSFLGLGLAGALGILLGLGVAFYAVAHPKSQAIVSLSFDGFALVRDSADNFDGYYTVETERRFGQLLAHALKGGAVAQALEKETAVTVKRVQRITDMDYSVEFLGDIEAQRLQNIISREFNTQTERSGEPLLVSASVSEVSSLNPISPPRATAAGGLLGIILGSFVILLRYYLKNTNPSSL